ncbi:hypothetical protein [Clostridium sp.]|uniref:hypothetical protein n=1 Tax=Clostridium sp. TaxID=1506 RepID=UPI003D6D2D7F
MYYNLTLQPDGLICVLEAEKLHEGLINLFFKLTGYNRDKEFVFNGMLTDSPFQMNDIMIIPLKEVTDIFSFLEDDFLKGDLYQEFKNKIEEM